MEENVTAGICDLVKAKVFDSEGTHVGHLQDLSISKDITSPLVNGVGVHFHWTDRLGEIELVRPVDDIACLVPWSSVTRFEPNELHIAGKHPDFSIMSAENLLLVRRDILNKQMIDRNKNRIQRVDDVMITMEQGRLKIDGLEVSGTFMLASPRLERFIEKLKKKYGRGSEIDMVPWRAIESIHDEDITLREDFLPE